MVRMLMTRAQIAQQQGAATFNKIGKEGANLERHLDNLFGVLRGIHDNQVVILTALAGLMAQQNNRIVASSIVPPNFARRM